MGSNEQKDPLKKIEWKPMVDSMVNETSGGQATKKRLPKKIRQIPDFYFLPRRSIPSGIAYYGSWILAGIGAGMLTEIWIDKKTKEDGGGVVWEFGK
ncbi:uncharacterized protein LOC124912415 [Impatiens glandulifera]|uniref:uncharacterized protein LOC124912415 n=1 Tax=Impatiens glandulifera TaxID=253017 RepID=UPI001FB0E425|nr:uncharacterized protein LOC124912415 [Impatiens glandulifera]